MSDQPRTLQERLREAAAFFEQPPPPKGPPPKGSWPGLLREAANSLDTRDKLTAEAVKALEPFANAITRAEKDEPSHPGNRLECCRTDITLDEFGCARITLAKLKAAQESDRVEAVRG